MRNHSAFYTLTKFRNPQFGFLLAGALRSRVYMGGRAHARGGVLLGIPQRDNCELRCLKLIQVFQNWPIDG